jgi:ribonuclease T1
VVQAGRSLPGRSLRIATAWLGRAAAVAAVAVTAAAGARTPDSPQAVPPVALAALPPEARTTHQLILQGGPFPYRKDGTVFFNRERLLPLKARGHYREYTVKTPGSRDRGARRIVCGGVPPTQPEACYYTADHYSSFQRIAQ